MNIPTISEYLDSFDFDIRFHQDARWIDQKCTPDVVCIIADCVVNLVEDNQDQEFTVNDIWDSEYFNENVKDVFSKPDPQNPTARSEYDKFIQQPLRMLGYAQILNCEKRGTTNYYSVKNFEILEFIALKERNAYLFLYEYIVRVLEDSELLRIFDDFKESYKNNHAPKQRFQELKRAYEDYILEYTPINGRVEIRRIFSKVINPYAVMNNIAGTSRGRISPHPLHYSELMYNRVNWRDIGKNKQLTRQEFDEAQDQPKAQAITKYLVQKAKNQIRRMYDGSEVQDELAVGQATQIHHIFPENEYPHLAAFLENLIKLTPSQHYTKAHPDNNTHIVDRDYQLVCLIAKSNSIEGSLNKDESFYNKQDFCYVINEGVYEEIVDESLEFDSIRGTLVHYYNSN